MMETDDRELVMHLYAKVLALLEDAHLQAASAGPSSETDHLAAQLTDAARIVEVIEAIIQTSNKKQ